MVKNFSSKLIHILLTIAGHLKALPVNKMSLSHPKNKIEQKPSKIKPPMGGVIAFGGGFGSWINPVIQ